MNTVVGVGWVVSVGHLAGVIALRAEILEADELQASAGPPSEALGNENSCPACGAAVSPDDTVCSGCGIALR